MSLGSGRCHYHPDRAGLGICVECRNVICTECTTQFEGINRCASCLQKRTRALQKLSARNDWSFMGVALALLSLTVLFGGFLGLAALLEH
jgi:hypothetical protein